MPQTSQNLFDASHYFDQIIKEFKECPKVLTIGRHADLEETTEVYCLEAKTNHRTSYFIPKQNLVSREGPESSTFHFVKVSEKENEPSMYWLVIHGVSRMGFLFPLEMFDDGGFSSLQE